MRLRKGEFPRLRHQDDEHHAPDGQQGIPHRVGDGVAETGDLALGTVIDHAKRGSRRARAGAASEHDRVVNAIVRGDRSGAAAAMREHIALVREEYELYSDSI